MPYTVRHDAELDLIEVTVRGSISGSDIRGVSTDYIDLQKRTGSLRILVDANESELDASMMEIYALPEKQYKEEGLDRRTRIAIIFPSSASTRQGALFYETICQNRGWNARVLPDRQSAIDWLKN